MKEENSNEETQDKGSSFHDTSSSSNPRAIGPIPHNRTSSDPTLASRLHQNRNFMSSRNINAMQGDGEIVDSGIQQQEQSQEVASGSSESDQVEESEGLSTPKNGEKSMIAEFMGFFGISEKILADPIKRKVFFIGSIGVIVTLIFLIIIVIVTQNGRVQNGREAVNSYLMTGEIEEEGEDQSVVDSIKNKFFDTGLYSYLVKEGWCKNGIDCYNSDAARFYKTFRRKIKNAENHLNSSEGANGNCVAAGFPITSKLDVPMLTSTFTTARNDDEYLSHQKDENYDEKLKQFSKEMDGLIDAMVAKENSVVYKVSVSNGATITTKSTTSEESCTAYGLTWKENSRNIYGGYCVKQETDQLPSGVTISASANSCYIVSEQSYKDYIVGNGKYYSTPGTYEQGGFTNPNSSVQNKNTSVQEYINSISEWATKDMSNSGIYASITIAQAILEGGSGKSLLASKYHNQFGIKGIGGSCSKSEELRKDPTSSPYWSGTSVCMRGKDGAYYYRAYNNIGESLSDHSDFFWRNKRYGKAGVLDCVQNNLGPREQITRIKKAGYAEDPSYVDKVMNLIDTHNLYQYDTGSYNGSNPNYGSGGNNSTNQDNNNNNAPNYYTSGGYLELYRMDLLEDYVDMQMEKESIYQQILDEALSYGSNFGKDNVITNQYGGITDSSNGDYRNWKQYDKAWGSIMVGTSNKTMKSIGCAITSVAIQIARSGTKVNIDNFNPGTFLQALNRNNSFQGGNFIWAKASTVAPYFQYTAKYNISLYNKQQKLDKINELINEGCYLIMSVKESAGHWVAVEGVTNDNIQIIDPGYANRTLAWPTYKVSNIQQLRCYKEIE